DLQQRSVLAQQVENLSQRVNNHDALMTGDGPSVLATAEPVARPQEWQVQASGSQEAHITRAECAAMITEALTGKVAPALGALHSHFGPQFQVHRQRIDHIESEVQKLKIRTAWVEKDVMFSQIEVAKRTLVLRNFPEWMTVQDRALTVNQAVREMGLSHVEWDLTTTQMDDGQGASNRLTVWFWEEDKTQPSQGESQPGVASTDSQPATASSSKAKSWKKSSYKGSQIKMTPGITQFERRLGAPMHGLMNAYQKAFRKYQKESLVPKWKTLFLTDQQDAWLGRILYQRRSQSLTATTGNPADWICTVQLPEEHKDAILTAWKEVWYDQLRQQVNLTQVEQHAIDTAAKSTSQDYAAAERLSRCLTRSIPPYNAGEEEGIENWTPGSSSSRSFRRIMPIASI
ncbi:unnamed protein product, partial [Symbiodinium pilosum]